MMESHQHSPSDEQEMVPQWQFRQAFQNWLQAQESLEKLDQDILNANMIISELQQNIQRVFFLQLKSHLLLGKVFNV
jgi:hypothetical protein